jgi:hypothetical protein
MTENKNSKNTIQDLQLQKLKKWENDMINKQYDELDLKIINSGGFWKYFENE